MMDALPSNTSVEDAVLGTAIRNQDYAGGLFAELSERHFHQSRAQVLWRHVHRLAADGVPITHELLWDSIKRSEDERHCPISYLLDVEATADAYGQHPIHILCDYADRRDAIRTAYRMIESAHDLDSDHKAAIMAVQADIASLGAGRGIAGPEHIGSILNRVFDGFAKPTTGGLSGLSCGIEGADRAIGGLVAGDLVVVAGRPAMGKTAFAECVASHVSQKTGVVFFSQEMASTKLAMRDLARQTSIQMAQLQANSFPRSSFPKISDAASAASMRNLWIDDSSGVSLGDITQRIRNIKHPIGLVVIDYIQLMRTTERRWASREQAISEVSRGLKVMARSANVCIMALAQLSREVERREDRRPMLSDLRESGAIEQDADIVMFLYRDEYYHADSSDKGTSELIVGKNRNGPVGCVKLSFCCERMLFCDPVVMV